MNKKINLPWILGALIAHSAVFADYNPDLQAAICATNVAQVKEILGQIPALSVYEKEAYFKSAQAIVAQRNKTAHSIKGNDLLLF